MALLPFPCRWQFLLVVRVLPGCWFPYRWVQFARYFVTFSPTDFLPVTTNLVNLNEVFNTIHYFTWEPESLSPTIGNFHYSIGLEVCPGDCPLPVLFHIWSRPLQLHEPQMHRVTLIREVHISTPHSLVQCKTNSFYLLNFKKRIGA